MDSLSDVRNYLALILVLLLSDVSTAQIYHVGRAFAKVHRPTAPPTYRHKGFIVKIDGDTIQGHILLGLKRRKISIVVPSSSKYERPDKRFISFDSVRFVRLFDNQENIDRPGYTDFVKFPHQRWLFRVVVAGKVALYDRSFYSDEVQVGYVSFKTLSIRKDDIFDKISGGNPEDWLIAEINKLFSKSFSKSDFKGRADMIDWLRMHAND